jgi:hypothetical protein
MDKIDNNDEQFHDKITLRYVDAMIYASGCTFDQFTRD